MLRLALDVPDWIGPNDVAPWIGAVPPALVVRFEQVLHDHCVDRGRDIIADTEPMELAARTLLAELAVRLPGMAGSTPEYLRRNLLDLAATVRVEPDRFVVELTDPPLHLLLSLTGMNRRRFRLETTGDTGDTGGRVWVLAPRG